MIAVPRWLVVVAVGCLVALPNWCRAGDDPQDALKKAQDALKKAQRQLILPGGNAVSGDVLNLAMHKKPGGYKTIDWQPNMKAAVEKAEAEKKPIFVFMNVNSVGKPDAGQLGQPNGQTGQYCGGSQATLDLPLSDERVIAKLAKDFVAVHLNLSHGFPKEAEGLKEIERAFKQSPIAWAAFSLSAVLTPDGKQVLGQSHPFGQLTPDGKQVSGQSHRLSLNTIDNFLMPNCLTFLEENLERYQKVAAK